jgi:hypothetical protein
VRSYERNVAHSLLSWCGNSRKIAIPPDIDLDASAEPAGAFGLRQALLKLA